MAVIPEVVATLIADTKEFTAKFNEAKGTTAQLKASTDSLAVTQAKAGATADQLALAQKNLTAAQFDLIAAQNAIKDGTLEGDAALAAQKVSLDAVAKAEKDLAASSAASADAQKRLAAANEESSGSFSKLGAIGSKASTALTAGLVAAAAISVKSAMDFQQSVASLAGSANISVTAANNIGKAFLKSSAGTVFSAGEMVKAYGSVAAQLSTVEGKALTATQAVKVMSAAGDLAEASNTSLASATKSLAGVMQAYKQSADQASKVTDVLFNTSRLTGQGIDQVSTMVEKLHGRLGAVTPSLKDIGGLMATLVEQGAQGRQAISGLSTAITGMLVPSTAQAKIIKDIGLNVYNANGKFVGFQSIITQLQPKLDGLTQSQQLFAAKTLFGSQSYQAMLQVIKQGPDAFDKNSAAVGRAGSAADAAAKLNQTFDKQIKIIKADAENLATSFGSTLLPAITNVTKAITTVIGFFQQNKVAAEALAAVVTGVLSVAVATFTINKMAAFGKSIQTAVSSLGTLVKTITGTAAVAETEGAAIGASFTAMLGPIALATAAAYGLYKVLTMNGMPLNPTRTAAADNASTKGTFTSQQLLANAKSASGSNLTKQQMAWYEQQLPMTSNYAKGEKLNFGKNGQVSLSGAPAATAQTAATAASSLGGSNSALGSAINAMTAGGKAAAASAKAAESAATKAAKAQETAAQKAYNAIVASNKTELSGMTKQVTTAHTAGLKEFNTLQSAITSGSLTKLDAALVVTHDGALKRIETRLDNTHKAALAKIGTVQTAAQKQQLEDSIRTNRNLSDRLVGVAKTAEAARTKALVAAALQKQIAGMSYQNTITSDTANMNATMTSDQATLTADQIAGASAQQLQADQAQLSWDQQIGEAQLAVDEAANGTALQQAQAAQNLVNIQAQAQTALANINAGITTGNAQATANSTTLSNAQSALQAQTSVPGDISQLAADQALIPGLTGAALTAAQAQVTLDQQKLAQDQALAGQSTAAANTNATAVIGATTDQTATLVASLSTMQSNDTTGFSTLGSAMGGIAAAIAGIPAPIVKVSLKIDGKKLAAQVLTEVLRQARSTGNALGQYAGGSQTGQATGINPNAVSR